ncbi:cell division protein FtsZ [Cochleicola gelatinilyticus]|uniref:Cell division protein FtsZ n=1 Tax=Cochleicola gelatinilyticus TaxID=1763537 RepID=A0A167F0L2_9FLAO|nr:cell division protein FtsZ [Cochleicola gelatinilyticus]OAB76067.1 cell division protein FtsZ [Cochleicola gelatinilyticus]
MSSNTEFDNISFDLPKNQSNVIKVIGVGGGGSNAINHMFSQGIKGVDFVICNTDSQALENSPVPIKIQLGVSLTEGLGAGANPKIGEQSAVESLEEIKGMLTTNTKMIFITAGMGGGTGTGAAPIIAQMAKDLDILTVGIVTIPFQFEGKMRNEQAHIGVENLRQNCDSLIVIDNNKLREVYGNLGFKAGFSKADEVLATAARGIAEVITHHYTQNIDLRDAKTVLANSGTAIMGSASASGGQRAHEAITKSLDSPLLNDNKIKGAKNVLLLIVSGNEEITIDEIGEISDHIQNEAGHSANIIMGVGEDESLEGAISITVIATGFNMEQQNEIVNTEAKKIIHTLEEEQRAEQDLSVKATSGTSVQLPKSNSNETAAPAKAPVIKHTLFEEVEETPPVKTPKASVVTTPKVPFEGYVETSELLRNLDISFEEINIHHIAEFEQLVINEIDVNDYQIISPTAKTEQKSQITSEVVSEKRDISEEKEVKKTHVLKDENVDFTEISETEDQILMFDLPINISEKKPSENTLNTRESASQNKQFEEERETLTSDIEDIEVNDHVEVVPVTELSDRGVKRYSLDDYQEMEDKLTNAKPSKAAEEEIVFEKKTVAPSEEIETAQEDETIDPMNTPINKLLRERTEERKRKMKEFNYKFRNSASHIEDIEKQPAYKRMGIELENKRTDDSSMSRTSVNTDDDDIELRSNNSFLHDNVD